MITIINSILLLVFVYYSSSIFNDSFSSRRFVKYTDSSTGYYQINKVMYYLIFVICTAPFFLGSVSLLKYAVYFITLVLLILKGYIQKVYDGTVKAYIIFIAWIAITIIWSPYPFDGFMLIIKYMIPLLSLWLGYSAIQNEEDLYFFSKYVTRTSLIYATFIGGMSAVYTPALYFALSNIFITYAGLADYFTAVIGLFFVLAWIKNKKSPYIGAVWLFLSTLLEVVRTGLGGITAVCSVFSLVRYKLNAIPIIIGAIFIFFSVVLYVPKVNEKFFGSNAGTVTIKDILQGNALSNDDIQTSGRDAMWDLLLAKFYSPSPIRGSGLGASTGYMKDKVSGYTDSDIVLIHSDYVQILCDSGLIGLSLLAFFFLTVLLKVGTVAFSRGLFYTKVSAALAIGSMTGIAFSMGYDNVVSHSMTSLIIPFVFIGFFLKFKQLNR